MCNIGMGEHLVAQTKPEIDVGNVAQYRHVEHILL